MSNKPWPISHDKIQNLTNFSHFRGEKYDSRIEQKSTYSWISFEIMVVVDYRAKNIKIRHGCRVLLLLLFCIFFHTEKDSISRYMSDNKPICFIESYMYIMRRHTCSKNTVVGYEKHTIKFWHGCLLCGPTCGSLKGLFSHSFRLDLTFDGVRCVSEMDVYDWLFFLRSIIEETVEYWKGKETCCLWR